MVKVDVRKAFPNVQLPYVAAALREFSVQWEIIVGVLREGYGQALLPSYQGGDAPEIPMLNGAPKGFLIPRP